MRMFRSRRMHSQRRSRGSRSRHGRELRSSVAGPYLPQLTGRIPRFFQVVTETVGFLQAVAPDLMEDVSVTVAGMPPADATGQDAAGLWGLDRPLKRVVIYRVPVERMARMSLSNPADQPMFREYVERVVMSGVNELLDGRLEDRLDPGGWGR